MMSLRNKSLDLVQEVDLQVLVDNKVREIKTVEYKQGLPGNSDGEKREFLYDISSLANASGGDLIYGMKEIDGVAAEVSGLQISNVDGEILRLEGIICTGIEPRIPGLVIHPVPLRNKGVAIVIRVPIALRT
jgi:predicted HTH transcriptional regulator